MKPVYTLSDLAEAAAATKPARLAVLGHPVAHSASPQLHQPALDAFGIDASYVRLDVDPGHLSQAFKLMRELGFIGCNVTVPHKFEAMAACSKVSPHAELLGAVNTVLFSDDETLGYNTDGPGIIAAIEEAFQIKADGVHTLILGAGGGAGQAIATQCCIQKPAKLTLVNRSLDKIKTLAARLKEISPDTEIQTLTLADPVLKQLCHQADLLIQTSSLGLKADDPKVIPDDYFLPHHCAYDTIYKPAETPFLASARKAGCKTDNGLSLLIHQGALAFKYWFPDKDALSIMREAMKNG
ncbi:MAG: shikimate dehydrogenase [Akkermansiaceae bacterium]